MPSTWMDLTNRLLRRVNDVEITQSDFASARGIQAAAKDYIQDTVREINTTKTNWPFNAVEHSQTLVVGTEEYAWPANFTAAEWGSFQIQADDTIGNTFKTLGLMTRDQWYSQSRDRDYDSSTDGRDIPTSVFPSHGQGFGVSPSPNEAYPIKFRYYKNPDDLTAYDSEVTIPNKFDYVILAGALIYMNLFKENIEGSQVSKVQFDKGLANMVNTFLPNETYAFAPRFNQGGGQKSYYKNMWVGQ
jgi:hypothetical protein